MKPHLKTKIMGIVNVTPDSFYKKSRTASIDHAIERAFALVKEGVDILDIGGESTRPNAADVTIEEELEQIAENEINLLAYPNPFMNETTIRFNTVESGQAEVAVFNLLGMKITTLFNGKINGAEIHEELFNAQNLPNGIYLVRLITEQGEAKAIRVVIAR